MSSIDLGAFTAKHRPALVKPAVAAFELWDEQSRCRRDAFYVLLCRCQDSIRPEVAYFAYALNVHPIPDFAQADEMGGQLRVLNEEQQRLGGLGTMFPVFYCSDGGMANVAPISFDRKGIEAKY